MKRAWLCSSQEKRPSCKAKPSLKWCATTHTNQDPQIINKGSSTIITDKTTSQEEEKADTIITEVTGTIGEAMAAEVATTRGREWLSSLIKKKAQINRPLKQHKFRIMAKSRSLGILAEDTKNLMKGVLANNNNTSQSFKLQIVRSKRLVILLPTDKFIRSNLSRPY